MVSQRNLKRHQVWEEEIFPRGRDIAPKPRLDSSHPRMQSRQQMPQELTFSLEEKPPKRICKPRKTQNPADPEEHSATYRLWIRCQLAGCVSQPISPKHPEIQRVGIHRSEGIQPEVSQWAQAPQLCLLVSSSTFTKWKIQLTREGINEYFRDLVHGLGSERQRLCSDRYCPYSRQLVTFSLCSFLFPWALDLLNQAI